MNLAETSVLALGLSAIVVFDRKLVSIEIRFLFFNFRIRRSGVSDLRIGVSHPAHDSVFCVKPVGPWHQGVERCIFGLRVGGVSKLKWRADITGGKNSLVGRAVMLVDFDAATVVFNASGF